MGVAINKEEEDRGARLPDVGCGHALRLGEGPVDERERVLPAVVDIQAELRLVIEGVGDHPGEILPLVFWLVWFHMGEIEG